MIRKEKIYINQLIENIITKENGPNIEQKKPRIKWNKYEEVMGNTCNISALREMTANFLQRKSFTEIN